ncbi:MAG: hypothetical protein WC763_06675 [Candidatus Paceibacterota bacterium]|jgi:hypothetical protein
MMSAGEITHFGPRTFVEGDPIAASGTIASPSGGMISFDGNLDFAAADVTMPISSFEDLVFTGDTLVLESTTAPGTGSASIETDSVLFGKSLTVQSRLESGDMFETDAGVVITPSATNPVAALASLPVPSAAEIADTLWLLSSDANRVNVGASGYVKEGEISTVPVTGSITFTDVDIHFSVSSSSAVELLNVQPGKTVLQMLTPMVLTGAVLGFTNVVLNTGLTTPANFRPTSEIRKMIIVTGNPSAYMFIRITNIGTVVMHKPDNGPFLVGENVTIPPFAIGYISPP